MLTVQDAQLAYKHRRAFIPRPSVDACSAMYLLYIAELRVFALQKLDRVVVS